MPTTDTGATPTGLSIDDAAAKLAELRKPPAKPVQAAEPEDGAAPVADPPSDGEIEPEVTDNLDTPDPDGEGEGNAPEGDPAEPIAQPASVESALKSLPAKELDRELYLPIGDQDPKTGERALEKITLREALRGSMRERDYTRKMMTVAEVAKHHVERRDQYEQVLPILVDQVKAHLGDRTEAEWTALYDSDPIKWAHERDRFNTNKQKLDALVGEQQRLAAEKQAESEAHQRMALVQEATRLRDHFKLQTAEQVQQFDKEVRNYLKTGVGLSDAEIGMVNDHRSFIVIHKAMQFDKLMAARKTATTKTAQGNAPVLQPGAKPGQQTGAKVAERKALDTLRKSGSMDAAAAALAARRKAQAKGR